jgi:N-acetylmuramoyl-L-alanine amidase
VSGTAPFQLRTRRSLPWGVLLLALSLWWAQGCASPRFQPEVAPAPLVSASPTWAELEALEAWLDQHGAAAEPIDRLEAELRLAEGRVRLAEADLAKKSDAPVVARIAAARSGYRSILESPDATADQRERARRGLERLEALGRTEPQAPVASTSLGNIIARARWGAASPNTSDMDRSRQDWSRITVHHTAMPGRRLQGRPIESVAATLRQIQKNHMQGEGWADIGYHFLIDPDGRVYEGRRIEWVGAHAGRSGGQNHNERNLGICLLGNFDEEQPSAQALSALDSLVASLRQRYQIAQGSVFGHCDFKDTACPGQALRNWLAAYKNGAARSSSRLSMLKPGENPSADKRLTSPKTTSGSSGRTKKGSSKVR